MNSLFHTESSQPDTEIGLPDIETSVPNNESSQPDNLYDNRIVHVDINSYFATILQQENPHLRGKPVGVVKDVGRTCIIAASKEAKKLGVKTGSRVPDALVKAPDIILVPARFDVYLDCTYRLKRVFADLAPTVDIFSLDEAFIDITDCRRLYPSAQEFGRLAQDKIKSELGEWVTSNVGISYTRLLAKLASEVSPKGSVVEITPENRDGYLATTPFEDVCGIGHRLEKRLRRIGVTNLYQINFMTEEDLARCVGTYWAPQLLKMAQGLDSPTLRGINDRRGQPMKSVGRTITGYGLCDSEDTIKRVLYNLCEEASSKVRKMNMAGRHIAVYLSGGRSDFGGWASAGQESSGSQSWYRHKTLKYYIRYTHDFFSHVYDGFYTSWQRTFPVIKFGVFLSSLKPMNQVPIQLFEEFERRDRVAKAVDSLNQRYGLFTVRPGTLTNGQLIRPEVTGFLGDKQYYGL